MVSTRIGQLEEAAANSRTSSSWVFGAKTIAFGCPVPSSRGDVALGFRPDLVHHLDPFAVREAGGIVPGLDLSLEARARVKGGGCARRSAADRDRQTGCGRTAA